MSMIINQEFMQSEVINPMARRLAEIEKKIDEILRYQKNFDSEIFCSLSRLEDNSKFLIEQFDKVIKNTKKTK